MFNLLFPDLCCICESVMAHHESYICIDCSITLAPLKSKVSLNSIVNDFFYGRVNLVSAYAMFSFHKNGNNQKLIHALKYRNKPKLGTILGSWFIQSFSLNNADNTIDYIIGVPIHKKRIAQRGYNQINTFGNAIAKHLDVPYSDAILKKNDHVTSQTTKNRIERWQSTAMLYSLNNKLPKNCKHILLVDDVITTGATIEACANIIRTNYKVQISVACIALVT